MRRLLGSIVAAFAYLLRLPGRVLRFPGYYAALLRDLALAPVLYLSLRVARMSRRFRRGSWVSGRVYDRVGVYPLLDHFYEPLAFPAKYLELPLEADRALPGIDFRDEAQLELLGALRFGDELLGIPREYEDEEGTEPAYNNYAFGSGDAEILYSLIRHLRPSRIVEVGSGHSTRFAVRAARANAAEDPGYRCRHVCIEPYQAPWLERLGVEVIREPVERLGREPFRELGEGDILFIDSSHVQRPQGDVLHLFLEVVPSLAPGVLVHVHDVFTPRDYPAEWILRDRRLWNEQYLVEALLSHSSRLQVVLALNYLHHHHPEALHAACPVLAAEAAEQEPGSLWLRTRA